MLLPCQFKDTAVKNLRYRELMQDQPDDLAIQTIFYLYDFQAILEKTPGIFKVTYPHQMSLIDFILLLLELYLWGQYMYAATVEYSRYRYFVVPLGTFMPYFYEDGTSQGSRAYVIIPGFFETRREETKTKIIEKTFSDILRFVQDVAALTLKYLKKFQGDPAHDLQKVLQEVVKDPEYIRLTEEFRVYQRLQFGLKFKNFYHPLICPLRATLYRDGIPALMKRDTQMIKTGFDFANTYQPAPLVVTPYSIEDIDFRRDESYAGYNWELFFHLPFLVAAKLNQDQRFEEAMAWYHYIFNPIGASDGPVPNKGSPAD
jgi:hypothetical protein